MKSYLLATYKRSVDSDFYTCFKRFIQKSKVYYKFGTANECEWDNFKKDMRKLTRAFPDMVFFVAVSENGYSQSSDYYYLCHNGHIMRRISINTDEILEYIDTVYEAQCDTIRELQDITAQEWIEDMELTDLSPFIDKVYHS